MAAKTSFISFLEFFSLFPRSSNEETSNSQGGNVMQMITYFKKYCFVQNETDSLVEGDIACANSAVATVSFVRRLFGAPNLQ
jgi:hypothetical protein